MFTACKGAHTSAELAVLKEKYEELTEPGQVFMAKLNDEHQYPVARAMYGQRDELADEDKYDVDVYGREASSTVEAMNQANKPARQVNAKNMFTAISMLFELEQRRFTDLRSIAQARTADLSIAAGKRFQDLALETNNYTVQRTVECNFEAHVTHIGSTKTRTVKLLMPHTLLPAGDIYAPEGLFLRAGCSCGVPRVDSFPCVHIIAVAKEYQVLQPLALCPTWCHTSTWKLQYPDEALLQMPPLNANAVRNMPPDHNLCEATHPPRKAGRPSSKRKKAASEGNKKRRPRTCLKCGMPFHYRQTCP